MQPPRHATRFPRARRLVLSGRYPTLLSPHLDAFLSTLSPRPSTPSTPLGGSDPGSHLAGRPHLCDGRSNGDEAQSYGAVAGAAPCATPGATLRSHFPHLSELCLWRLRLTQPLPLSVAQVGPFPLLQCSYFKPVGCCTGTSAPYPQSMGRLSFEAQSGAGFRLVATARVRGSSPQCSCTVCSERHTSPHLPTLPHTPQSLPEVWPRLRRLELVGVRFNCPLSCSKREALEPVIGSYCNEHDGIRRLVGVGAGSHFCVLRGGGVLVGT